LVASRFRNWEHDTDDPPSRRAQIPPVTTSMVAPLLVGGCQDRDNAFVSLQTVASLYPRGEIGSAAVRHAVRVLASQELTSPAHLAASSSSTRRPCPPRGPSCRSRFRRRPSAGRSRAATRSCALATTSCGATFSPRPDGSSVPWAHATTRSALNRPRVSGSARPVRVRAVHDRGSTTPTGSFVGVGAGTLRARGARVALALTR
jgi:hypothetical protein